MQEVLDYNLGADTPEYALCSGIEVPIVLDTGEDADFVVRVFGLDPAEYTLRSNSHGAVRDGDTLPLQTGEQERLSLCLLDRSEPEAPRRFGVLIRRVCTVEGRKINRQYIARRFLWMPRPRDEDFEACLETTRYAVRPWTRRVCFRMRLTNKSYVPIKAVPRLCVETEGAGAQIEQEWIECANPAESTVEMPGRTKMVWACVRGVAGSKSLPQPQLYQAGGNAVVQIKFINNTFAFRPAESAEESGGSDG